MSRFINPPASGGGASSTDPTFTLSTTSGQTFTGTNVSVDSSNYALGPNGGIVLQKSEWGYFSQTLNGVDLTAGGTMVISGAGSYTGTYTIIGAWQTSMSLEVKLQNQPYIFYSDVFENVSLTLGAAPEVQLTPEILRKLYNSVQ